MEPFSKEEFLELADIHDKHCISMYMPTSGIKEVEKDQLQLKNLLKEVGDVLRQHKLSSSEVERILKPADPLVADTSMWRALEAGMAIFVYDGQLRRYNSSVKFKPSLHVDDHLHLLPLVDLVNANKDFFLLVLSVNQAKLFRGNIERLVEIDTEDFIPNDLLEAVGTDYQQKSIQYRVHKGEEGDKGMFHGHGAGGTIEKQKELKVYFKEISKGLDELVGRDRGIPMILACVESHCSLFREISDYTHIMDQSISGNHENTHPQDLHAQAVEILKSLDEEKVELEKERFRELLNKGMSSDNEKEIISAAYQGKVDVLFVNKDRSLSGYYDPGSDKVKLDDHPHRASTDLLNFSAIQTVRNRGNVYLLDPNEMPESRPLLAIYRYAS